MSDETAMRRRAVDWFESSVVRPMEDFNDPKQEWRRLFSELLGTFFLVLVAAGGGMMGQAFPDTIERGAAVTAPGLMVMAIILFMGKVSGAHLNPAVSLAFAARGDFPWRRVPGYIVIPESISGVKAPITPRFCAPDAVPKITLTKPNVRISSIQNAAPAEYVLAG